MTAHRRYRRSGTALRRSARGPLAARDQPRPRRRARHRARIRAPKRRRLFITYDADGQHAPEDIDVILGPLTEGKADAVIGSRLINPAGMPWYRVFGNWGLQPLHLRRLRHVDLTDSQSGMRGFSKVARHRSKSAWTGWKSPPSSSRRSVAAGCVRRSAHPRHLQRLLARQGAAQPQRLQHPHPPRATPPDGRLRRGHQDPRGRCSL